jgi:hypothetical protein
VTVQARPEPKPITPPAPTVHELLVTVQRHHHDNHELLKLLREHLQAAARPARMRGPYRLNAAAPMVRDDVGHESPSFGIYNPNAVSVYLGLGAIPRPGAATMSVPPNSLVVLPLAAGDIDLGVDPTDPLLVGDAVVLVLRFDVVQPAFLGAL